MRQVVMHGPGDVRVEDREDPRIIEPTDAIIRLEATCICGSDLWPYRGAEPVDHQVMGHEYVGVVQEIGSAVRTVKVGDFVVGSFWASDNTCDICRAISVWVMPAEAARPAYEAKKAAYDAKRGRRRGRPPKPPEDEPPPGRQSNLTDPDSALMRRSDAHEYRQAYNAQAVVCAEGSQLILATGVAATTADAPSFAAAVLAMENTVGLPETVLADTGFASAPAVAALEGRGIEPLVAIGRTQPHRPYDFRPPPEPKKERRITEPWRIAMKAKLETDDAKALYAKRKQTVEPAFGIIKSAMGFVRFHLRGLRNAATEWTLVALAYNCRRLHRMQAA